MASLEQLLADLTSGDEARAEAAVPALTVHGETAAQALRELLTAPQSEHRWWATRALAKFPQSAARSALLQSLSDPDDSVRQCAALSLQHNPTRRAISPLTETLASEDRLLARLAANALAAIGAPAVPALDAAARAEDPRVRIEAVRALAHIKHPDVIGPLFKSIDDPSTVVQHWAEQGLDRLGLGMTFFSP